MRTSLVPENDGQKVRRVETVLESDGQQQRQEEILTVADPDLLLSDTVVGAVQTRGQRQRSTTLRPLKVDRGEEGCDTEHPISAEEQDGVYSVSRNLQTAAKGKVKVQKISKRWHRINISQNGEEVKQLLVPKCKRERVLRLAHASLMSGHLGIKKTEDRILSSFYWPSVSRNVKRWCKSCDLCQRTVLKGRVTKVPLGKMPVMTIPFQKVALDLVGPLSPASARGNKWVLTVVDYATRWSEAIPLRSIDTESIAEALLGVFTRVGLPQEILSNRGTQFTSQLMNEVCRLINVKQAFTAPCHPMSNGLNEKFIAIFKKMLKKM